MAETDLSYYRKRMREAKARLINAATAEEAWEARAEYHFQERRIAALLASKRGPSQDKT